MAVRRELRASSDRIERSPTGRTLIVLAAGLGILGVSYCYRSSSLEAEEPQKTNRLAVPATPLSFEGDIQPLFTAKCLRCHGDKVRKGSLDLSSWAGLLKGSESGPVVVPGKPDDSLLYQMVRDGKMPAGKKDKLTKAELETIRRWIAGGARFRTDVATGPAVTQHDVIPILLRRCAVCHGQRQREGGLDLSTKASMLRGGKLGPAIVPGKPEESLIIKRIRAGEMPPRRRLVE